MSARSILGPVLLSAAVGLAACSSSGSGSTGTGPAGTSRTAHSGTAMQSVAITVKSGHLVGPDGRTLYYNTVDTPTKIQCTGTCASIWPPVLGTPHPGPGLTAANFTTATRPDGGSQVVYQNHPLYEFGADKAGGMSGAGMTDGGGKWIVAMVGQAAGGGTSPSDTMSTGAGGGYGGY